MAQQPVTLEEIEGTAPAPQQQQGSPEVIKLFDEQPVAFL